MKDVLINIIKEAESEDVVLSHISWMLSQDSLQILNLLDVWKDLNDEDKYLEMKGMFGRVIDYYPSYLIKYALNTYVVQQSSQSINKSDIYTYSYEICDVKKEESRLNMTYKVHIFKNGQKDFTLPASISDYSLCGDTCESLFQFMDEAVGESLHNPNISLLTGANNLSISHMSHIQITEFRDIAYKLSTCLKECNLSYESIWENVASYFGDQIKCHIPTGEEIPKSLAEFLMELSFLSPSHVYVEDLGFVINYVKSRTSYNVVVEKTNRAIYQRVATKHQIFKRFKLHQTLLKS